MKYLREASKEEVTYFVTQLKGREATTAEGSMAEGAWSGWSHCTPSQEQREENDAVQLASLFLVYSLFIQFGFPIQEMVLSILRVHLPSSVR